MFDLHNAIEDGDLQKVQDLLDNGADIEERNNCEATPLFWAAQYKFVDAARLLLERNADVNCKCCELGKTAMHDTAYHNDIKMARLLIQYNCRVDEPSQTGRTPIQYALFKNSFDVIDLLLEHHADPNQDTMISNNPGDSLLHGVVGFHRMESVKLLVEHHANVNHVGFMGRTPLHIAAAGGNLAAVNYLLLNGADAFMTNADDDGKLTPLACAAGFGHQEVVVRLHTHQFEGDPSNWTCDHAVFGHFPQVLQDQLATLAQLWSTACMSESANPLGLLPIELIRTMFCALCFESCLS